MKAEKAVTLCLITLLSASLSSTINAHPLQQPGSPVQTQDPLGRFQGSGTPVGLSWTGVGQRIINPSFDTGSLAPWIKLQYNTAAGSNATITSIGYNGLAKSAQLSVFSANITANSHLYLLSDFSSQPVPFGSGLRFRAATLVQQLTGYNMSDRVEANLNLTTSTGHIREIHYVFAYAASLPANSTTDEFIRIGTVPTGQWISIDRQVATDAAAGFPSDYSSFDSVSQVTVSVYAQTEPGPANRDPHLKFWDIVGNGIWQTGEPVVYDTNLDGKYETGEPVVGGCTDGSGNPILCSPPPNGTIVVNDPKIKFVNSTGTSGWVQGEPIVWDQYDTNIVNYYDTVIIGPKPAVGTPLMKISYNHSSSLFDQIELYSQTTTAWTKNGGFESGLAGWYANSSFTQSTTTFHSGTQSARGNATNAAIEMTQSIDSRPTIDSTTTFSAWANIATMSGTASSSIVDIWLGLVDSKSNPATLYYVFDTGDGSLPKNNTDTLYMKASNFGTLNQWTSVNVNLLQQASVFNSLGYTPPYSVEVVVVEVKALAPSATTISYFDDISIVGAGTQMITPKFFAVDGQNTTYTYVATAIPQLTIHAELPGGESILNITSPDGSTLQSSEYTSGILATCTVNPCFLSPRAIDIPQSTTLGHSPGDWRIFATSMNALTTIYAEDPVTHSKVPNVNAGSSVNLVSQSKGPFGQPLIGVAVNITLWSAGTGIQMGSWAGTTDTNGWYNVTGLTLPLTGTSPGIYSLQATVYSIYPGIRTFQISVRFLVAITIATSASDISQGESATISGTVTLTSTSTPGQGINVTIYYRQAGDSQYTRLATVKTDSSGKFSYSWNPPQGQYEVKASTGDYQTAPTDSTPVQLIVGPPAFPWTLVIIAIVAAAAAVGVLTLLVFRRRKKMMKLPAQPAITQGPKK